MKTQQRFKVKNITCLLKKLIRIPLSSNDDKRMQSIGLIETYAYGMSKDLVSEKKKENKSNKWLNLNN